MASGNYRLRGNAAQGSSVKVSRLVQARRANVLVDSPGFSAVIVATNGTMARMNTVHPASFVAFKRWMANQADREALKRRLCSRRIRCRNC